MSRECRFCRSPLEITMVDLGMSPLSNAFLTRERLNAMEKFYPLHVYVCSRCFLVQLEEFESPESIFSDYMYFSSYSDTWLAHCQRFACRMIEELGLGRGSSVIELASNDGYLLQFFAGAGVAVLGIEPAANVARVAREKGIPTRVMFFGQDSAADLRREGHRADLLIGNNVYAHVPDINGFTAGMACILAPQGVISLEFPHLCELMAHNQFDTIYHEHFSYLSLLAVERIFAAHGLRIYAVERLPTHGGSLRVFGCHRDDTTKAEQASVELVRSQEKHAGLDTTASYTTFAERVYRVKRDLLSFMIQAKKRGRRIAAYGAAAKGNTLLNFCGIRGDFVDFVADRSPHKQGHYLPGTHLPVVSPDMIRESRPDYVLILPWNLRAEVAEQLAYVREWGGRFVVPIPEVEEF